MKNKKYKLVLDNKIILEYANQKLLTDTRRVLNSRVIPGYIEIDTERYLRVGLDDPYGSGSSYIEFIDDNFSFIFNYEISNLHILISKESSSDIADLLINNKKITGSYFFSIELAL
jgi:hypothetical protein